MRIKKDKETQTINKKKKKKRKKLTKQELIKMSKKMSKPNLNIAGNSKVLVGIIVTIALIIFAVFVVLMNNLLKTETYYQLNLEKGQTFNSKGILSAEMIDEGYIQEVATTVKPANAITRADIESGQAQAKYELGYNEVLTYGNVGPVGGTLHDDLIEAKKKDADGDYSNYDNWILTNFSVSADNAVGGRIQPGDYFDIMVISEEGTFYPFINLKAIDTTVSIDSAGLESADSMEAKSGQTNQYTVKLSPDHAAYLQWIINNNQNVKLVLNDKSDEFIGAESEEASSGNNPYDGWNRVTGGTYMPFEQVDGLNPNNNVNSSSDNESRAQELERQRENERILNEERNNARTEEQAVEETETE